MGVAGRAKGHFGDEHPPPTLSPNYIEFTSNNSDDLSPAAAAAVPVSRERIRSTSENFLISGTLAGGRAFDNPFQSHRHYANDVVERIL